MVGQAHSTLGPSFWEGTAPRPGGGVPPPQAKGATVPSCHLDRALWAAIRDYARGIGHDMPLRVGIHLAEGMSLLLSSQAGTDRVIDWNAPLGRPAASLWVFEGRWVCYAGAGEKFPLLGQHRQLLEVLAGSAGRAVSDDTIRRKTTIPTADRLRKVASELREVLRHRLSLAADPVARDGGGYRLTVI